MLQESSVSLDSKFALVSKGRQLRLSFSKLNSVIATLDYLLRWGKSNTELFLRSDNLFLCDLLDILSYTLYTLSTVSASSKVRRTS